MQSAFAKKKQIEVVLFKYSATLESLANFELFQKTLLMPAETDRSGAPAEVIVRETVERLKQVWGKYYQSYYCNWRLWADRILKSPPHQHEFLLSAESSLPHDMVHLFYTVHENPEVEMNRIKRANEVSIQINDKARGDFGVARDLLHHVETAVDRLRSFLDSREQVLFDNHEFLLANERAYKPVFDNQALELLGRVADQEDFEHMEE